MQNHVGSVRRERSFININSSPQAVFKVPRRNYLLTDLYLMRMVAILSQTNWCGFG